MNYVYLHGFCSGANSYKGSYMRERFSQAGLKLHTPDLNGDDFEHLTISNQLEIIDELIAPLDGPVTLFGSSMGGYLAALYAENTTKVSELILIAPAFQFVTRYLNRLDTETLENWKKDGYLEIFHYAYQENRKLHYGILADAAKFDTQALTRQIPVLIIHGINDDSVPYNYSIDYLTDHPQTDLILLNGDHSLTDHIETIWRYINQRLSISK